MDDKKKLGHSVDAFYRVNFIANVLVGLACALLVSAVTMVMYYHAVPIPDLRARFAETGQLPIINPSVGKRYLLLSPC